MTETELELFPSGPWRHPIPGPWTADQHRDDFPRQIVIENDNGRIIAVCDNNDEQDEPTAILIAAAPDMFDYISTRAKLGDQDAIELIARLPS